MATEIIKKAAQECVWHEDGLHDALPDIERTIQGVYNAALEEAARIAASHGPAPAEIAEAIRALKR